MIFIFDILSISVFILGALEVKKTEISLWNNNHGVLQWSSVIMH